MSTRLVFAALVSAVLLSSYSSAIAADVRPEVAQPLDQARVLANGWSDKAVVLAKLNQAASVPNLNQAEQDKIRATTIYALARVGQLGPAGIASGAPQAETTPPSALNNYGYMQLH
jgi:hypothetical protein